METKTRYALANPFRASNSATLHEDDLAPRRNASAGARTGHLEDDRWRAHAQKEVTVLRLETTEHGADRHGRIIGLDTLQSSDLVDSNEAWCAETSVLILGIKRAPKSSLTASTAYISTCL